MDDEMSLPQPYRSTTVIAQLLTLVFGSSRD